MSGTSVTAFLIENTVEFSLMALVVLAAAAILRRRSAALRHWMLSSAVACAAIAPLLGFVVPSWQLPIDALPQRVGLRSVAGSAVADVAFSPAGSESSSSEPASGVTGAEVAAAVWAAGAAANVAVLLAGLWRLRRVTSRSHAARPRWTRLAADISQAYGLRRDVRLLQSDHPTLLVTCGILRPKVILPSAARDWIDERVRVVLSHELAHVRRGDWLVQIAAEVLRSIYWFNPLAWMLCSRVRHESEHATDDVVLNAGIEGGNYATHLLEIARAIRPRTELWWPAPAIVRASTLERRITVMLNANVNRAPVRRSSRLVTVVALLGLAAAITSAQSALGTFSGTVLDPMNRTLPNATLVLTHTGTNQKHEIRSDHTGRFEFANLPRGEYAIEAKLPGFAAVQGTVTMAGHNLERNLNLEIGTLVETVTVTPDQTDPPANPELQRRHEDMRAKRERSLSDCVSTPHGGNIRPPMKLNHVAPQYPVHLGNANVGGTVLMQAVIAKDGAIKEVHVVTSAHPDLDRSATEAIRQWRFDSTLLNCMPVEVNMKVKVDFKAN